MAHDFNISVSLPFELPAGAGLLQMFPTLSFAVARLAEIAEQQWVSYANGAALPDGRTIPGYLTAHGDYARSIKRHQTGDLAWRIQSDFPAANRIEQGSPSYDMKQALRTSLKVRISKQGARYLIIPFRHGTPTTAAAGAFRSVMPEHVHELARQLSASRITGSAKVPNAIGVHDIHTRLPQMITRRSYSWGDKLPAGTVSKLSERHATDPFAGMVRFDAPQKGHSQYLTFRTMSEHSSGWIRAAQPGFWPAREVAHLLQPKAEAVFAEALKHDLEQLGFVAG